MAPQRHEELWVITAKQIIELANLPEELEDSLVGTDGNTFLYVLGGRQPEDPMAHAYR